MNIKDRLNSLKNQNSSSLKIKEEVGVSQFFKRDEEAEKIIVKGFNSNKNFILLCDKKCNKQIICSYINRFITNTETTEILQNITEDLKYTIAKRVIATEPNIKDIINILKLSINDFKSFVFTMNAREYENVINSLCTLLLIELPNLKSENIEYLIGVSEAMVLFFSTDKDGIYYIKNIGEITYKKNNLTLSNIFPEKKSENENTTLPNNKEFEQTEESSKEEIGNKQEEKTQTIDSKTIENKEEKLNKYKLLKEKAKRKKL